MAFHYQENPSPKFYRFVTVQGRQPIWTTRGIRDSTAYLVFLCSSLSHSPPAAERIGQSQRKYPKNKYYFMFISQFSSRVTDSSVSGVVCVESKVCCVDAMLFLDVLPVDVPAAEHRVTEAAR
jgi:hypothetical protein